MMSVVCPSVFALTHTLFQLDVDEPECLSIHMSSQAVAHPLLHVVIIVG